MTWKPLLVGGLAVLTLTPVSAIWSPRRSIAQSPPVAAMDAAVTETARQMLAEGRRVFRYETVGDEAYWGETLKLHRAIAGAKLGGVGPGVSPKTAVPTAVAAARKAGRVDLNDPASTLVLLKANAVVGVTGHFDSQGTLTSLGVQCAFCHSTVDDSFAPGIGHRQDGWANRDLNVGAIVGVAPDLRAITTLAGWQAGRDPYPARLRSGWRQPAYVGRRLGDDLLLECLCRDPGTGFYHDGRFADLAAVVDHYNQFMKLALSDAEKRDLMVE
jgi:hypothetical protein